MSLIGTQFELRSYKRFVMFKYYKFLSEYLPYNILDSLSNDLNLMCADSTTEESLREIAEHFRNTELSRYQLSAKVARSINNVTSIYTIYKLIFLIDPIMAERLPEH